MASKARSTYRSITSQQINQCINKNTLARYRAGLKLIVTNDQPAVFMQVEQFELADRSIDAVYDPINVKLYLSRFLPFWFK